MTTTKGVAAIPGEGGRGMVRLTKDQLKKKKAFIRDYIAAANPASGSRFDSNANITRKTLATLANELTKDIYIQINREIISDKIAELFGEAVAEQYHADIESHVIYPHDQTSCNPYCVAISMYPFLLDGLKTLGGESGPPLHLKSFCGGFVNLLFAVSAQFAGAVATPEFLMYFDHFAAHEYGDDYLATHEREMANYMQQIAYSINQPAAARGNQSIFWNVSIFDSNYFGSLFENFYFPDGARPDWHRVDKLQRWFLKWINSERTRALLTFPVMNIALLSDGKGPVDAAYGELTASELAAGNSFFVYMSETVESLSSCCRLSSALKDIQEFSYTLGAGGVATGSINVITMNINRIFQMASKGFEPGLEENRGMVALAHVLDRVHGYQIAYRKLMDDYKAAGMLEVYDAGYISLDKQFLTIGINGVVEAAEFFGYMPSNNSAYIGFVSRIFELINRANRAAAADTGYRFNCEMVPAENLGVKNADWDRKDGLKVGRDCYNSYLFPMESDSVNILDKFIIHGRETTKWLDGGSALHLNLGEYPTVEGYRRLLEVQARTGCPYMCTNVLVTICEKCGHIDKRTLRRCEHCGSDDISHATRIIGYLKKIKHFGGARQTEAARRAYHVHPADMPIVVPAPALETKARESLETNIKDQVLKIVWECSKNQ